MVGRDPDWRCGTLLWPLVKYLLPSSRRNLKSMLLMNLDKSRLIFGQDLHISLIAVSLTITSYLIIQGVSPLLWGTLSDTIGRRQIYIYSFLVYISANVGLSFSPTFTVLVIFRGLQAAGSASTVSIGACLTALVNRDCH